MIITIIETNRNNKHKPNSRSREDYKYWYYNTYLRSSHWRKTRVGVLVRAGYRCEECGNNRSLQIHHLSYSNLGNESPYELQCLCSKCHKKTHHIQ